ncbi:family 2A encapsulin nanocompartment cargo protein cysteine desulfurase [Pseudonocardia spinosispora]|uniref:family 2A encapsulin nanocompartment cargo protein cysteine desulfurase n=1 Tax=Pseudonocardia spinosispora TaxID=103441 RepID=UPI000560689C|nr:family 2A encapsulin nanocompartment cargo protein cysteine desulfurase [Pseudonocardia spinosispora]
MTTPPTTADGAVPPWLPDEATLTRMASELFSALPGQDPSAAAGASPSGLGHGSPSSSGAPVPVGMPAADLPPPAPRSRPSSPSLPPPTSAPVVHGATAAGFVPPMIPEVPTLMNLAPEPGPGTSADPGAFYFLSGRPELPTAVPSVPGFEHRSVPRLSPVSPEQFGGERFYFLDGGGRNEVPDLPLDPHPAFDVHAVRRDFPILSERVNGRPLIWFDNGATTQKPQSVIDRLAYFYAHENSNIHRAAHELAARSTDAYESARDTVARFIGAGSSDEIVFVRGSTEAINLVAQSWGRANIGAGDEIVISHLEHHANIVPWQQLAAEKDAVLRVIPVDEDGQIVLSEYQKLVNDRTKLVAVTQVSNALGTITPIRSVIEMAHAAGALALVDGAQSVPHAPVDVTELDADFLVFSGHKVFGPTGIGVLYGKSAVLESMPPWQGGGNMIADVTLEGARFQDPPNRFEAGTGNIADAVGLGAALDYVQRIGMPTIARYEHDLLIHATRGLRTVPGLRIVGTAPDKASVLSFVLDGYEPVEVGTALNEEGIAVRAGHHCAQPILRRYGLEGTVRASLAFYNTRDEIDVLVAALTRLAENAGR